MLVEEAPLPGHFGNIVWQTPVIGVSGKAIHPLFATVIAEALEFRECQTSSWGDEDTAEGHYFTEALPL